MSKGSYPPQHEDRWCVKCERLHSHFHPHNVAYYDATDPDSEGESRAKEQPVVRKPVMSKEDTRKKLREELLKRLGIPAHYYVNIDDKLNNIDTVMSLIEQEKVEAVLVELKKYSFGADQKVILDRIKELEK